jgi:predicted transcriptional regulator
LVIKIYNNVLIEIEYQEMMKIFEEYRKILDQEIVQVMDIYSWKIQMIDEVLNAFDDEVISEEFLKAMKDHVMIQDCINLHWTKEHENELRVFDH